MDGLEIIRRPAPQRFLRQPRLHRIAVGSLAVLTAVTWVLGLGLLMVGSGG